MFEMLIGGFQNIFAQPVVLLMCFLGCSIGTVIGAIPGLGPATAIAVLLPAIYGKEPLASMVMLAGIFAGSMFGGAISSITLNVPGTSSSMVTTFDGYPMAAKGQAGKAIGIAAVSSFIGGTLATVLLCILGTPLAKMALKFGPPEYFCIYVLTFVLIIVLTGGSPLKNMAALFLGLLFASVGMDPSSGVSRLTFGNIDLMGGIEFLPAIIGLFGMSEIVIRLASGKEIGQISGKGDDYKLKNVLPSRKDLKVSLPTIIRQGIFGFLIGVLPGAGASIATLTGYSIEKRLVKDSENFGKGDIRGIAAPESANNGSCVGSYVPLLTMGIPGSATSALLLGAFVMVGIQPGPLLFSQHPDVAGGLIASMYVGNVILLIVNTALIPLFILFLKKSGNILPVIVAGFCIIGSYTLRNNLFDVIMMLVFTGIGVFYKKLDMPPAPTIIALVLGYELEFSFSQTEILLHGNLIGLFNRPICVMILLVCFSFIVLTAVTRIRKIKR